MSIANFDDYREIRARRQNARERERQKQADRFSAALRNAKRLAPQDRERLARNIGRIAEERAAALDARMRPMDLLRKAFTQWAETVGEERWLKRLRWSRLEADAKRSEALSGNGESYLELALSLSTVSEWDETWAVIRLIEGTSFLPAGTLEVPENGGEAARLIARDITRLADDSIPELRRYFETVERLGVHHPIREDQRHYSVIAGFDTSRFDLPPWDGTGSSGQLVAREMCDGQLMGQEFEGAAALLPSVRIADLSCDVCVEGTWLIEGYESDAPLSLGPVQAERRWAAYVVLGPPETPKGSLRLGLVLDAVPSMGQLTTDDQSIGIQPNFQYGRCTVFDSTGLGSNETVRRLEDHENLIWWLHGSGCTELITQRALPIEFAYALTEPGSSFFHIIPRIQTGGYVASDPGTLEGIIDANVKHHTGSANLISLLFNDARARMKVLDQHLEVWRQQYASATEKLGNLRHEP